MKGTIMETVGADVRKDNKTEKGRNGTRNVCDSGICCSWHFQLGPAVWNLYLTPYLKINSWSAQYCDTL